MGGECNYLLRVAGESKRLQFVPDAEWKSPTMAWREEDIQRLLAEAEGLLLEGASRLRLPVEVGARVHRQAQKVVGSVLLLLLLLLLLGGSAVGSGMREWVHTRGAGGTAAS